MALVLHYDFALMGNEEATTAARITHAM